MELRLPELLALFRENEPSADSGEAEATASGDLLGTPADWGPAATSAGSLQLVPVRIERDAVLISRWMNDPAVAAFWDLAGPTPSPPPTCAPNSTATAAASPASASSTASP